MTSNTLIIIWKLFAMFFIFICFLLPNIKFHKFLNVCAYVCPDCRYKGSCSNRKGSCGLGTIFSGHKSQQLSLCVRCSWTCSRGLLCRWQSCLSLPILIFLEGLHVSCMSLGNYTADMCQCTLVVPMGSTSSGTSSPRKSKVEVRSWVHDPVHACITLPIN